MPSLTFLTPDIHRTIQRFPVPILCSFLLFLLVKHMGAPGSAQGTLHLTLAVTVCYFTFVIFRIIREQIGGSFGKEVLTAGFVAFLLTNVLIAWFSPWTIGMVFASLLLCLSYAPFFLKKRPDDLAFWYYNWRLWSGFFTACVSGSCLISAASRR